MWWVFDADGSLITMAELFEREQGFRLPRKLPHEVHYRGKLLLGGNTLCGSWRVRPRTVETTRGTAHIEMECRGTWRAERVGTGRP